MTASTAPQAHPPNNFDFVRLVAASMVLYSHHFILAGLPEEPKVFGIISFGHLAVVMFFSLSGYLVTQSWQSDPHIFRFAMRRILRIWPALAAVVIFCALILGPLVTSAPLLDYFENGGTWSYFQNLIIPRAFHLPGVFENNPYPLSVNGSLWTIPIEVLCYMVLGAAGFLGLMKKRSVWLTAIGIYLIWYYFKNSPDTHGTFHMRLDLWTYFLLGSAIYTLRPWWQSRAWQCAAVLFGSSLIFWHIGLRHLSVLLSLPFCVIAFSQAKTPFICQTGRYGDFSYGIYIFAFPVQQSLMWGWSDQLGFYQLLIISFILTLILACLSWHLIEEPALKLKPRKNQPVFEYLGQLARKTTALWPGILWVAPLGVCIYGWHDILLHFHDPILPDPLITYLPAARDFLDQGFAFLLSPTSYRVAPLTYLWPALWGADPALIRLAHMGVWAACVFFLWQSCLWLGGKVCALIALGLLLLTPQLLLYFPSEMSEPLYLLGFFAWLHALAALFLRRTPTRWYVAQAALALTVMLLTRPVFQLMAPAALLGCLAFMAWGRRLPWALPPELGPHYVRPIAWSLFLGLLLPLCFVIKNGLLFGLWGLGTGAGAGLYLGLHPLTQGTEPGFLGFTFDINSLIWGLAPHNDHLDLAGERIARAAAIWQLKDMTASQALLFFGQKTWWWLAHQPMELKRFGSILRNVRIFELLAIFSALIFLFRQFRKNRAFVQTRRPSIAFFATILLIAAALLVQFLPILHNARYSATFFDPLFIIATSLALAWLIFPAKFPASANRRNTAIYYATSLARTTLLFTLLTVCTVAILTLARRVESIAIHPALTGYTTPLFHTDDIRLVQISGALATGEKEWITTKDPAVLHVAIFENVIKTISKPLPLHVIWETRVKIQTPSKEKCNYVDSGYLTGRGVFMQSDVKFPLRLKVKSSPHEQVLLTHANYDMRPQEPGQYQLQFLCPVGTKIQWISTRLLESTQTQEATKNIAHLFQNTASSSAKP